MKSLITIIREQISSFYLILRLSAFEIKSANNNNYLGRLWELLNPLIQLSIYWLVFGIGVRGGQSITMENGAHVPFFIWMVTGMIVWFFVNPAISKSTRSIYSRLQLISKMSFPMSAIPSFVIMAHFYTHLMLVAVVMVFLQFTDFKLSVYYLQLPYFMLGTLIFLLALGLITSTLSTMIRDVQQIVQSVLRMMLYLTPLIWHTDKFEVKGMDLTFLLKLNPLYYLVEGYRASLLGTTWYFVKYGQYTLYFWALLFMMLALGSALHLKFRNRFVDYL
ncbi:teichoic acid ABC transporter permease [Mesobacillus campisalis]|uniref:Transport permease protein n=1 Tax=Mesobacillus campisalis TaxID=1408103 RepID=A0A0M2SS10_9BACI|nr:ABC transporter permease [Mesobacillus campisalis]KKK36476.1 teichoic acid ABC transporter permease [Mesobacillus campisalis]